MSSSSSGGGEETPSPEERRGERVLDEGARPDRQPGDSTPTPELPPRPPPRSAGWSPPPPRTRTFADRVFGRQPKTRSARLGSRQTLPPSSPPRATPERAPGGGDLRPPGPRWGTAEGDVPGRPVAEPIPDDPPLRQETVPDDSPDDKVAAFDADAPAAPEPARAGGAPDDPRSPSPSLFDRIFGAPDDMAPTAAVAATPAPPATEPDAARQPGRAARRKRQSSRALWAAAAASVAILVVLGFVVVALISDDDDEAATTTATSSAPAGEAPAEAPGRGGECENGRWPGLTQGEPLALAAGASGFFVWNDLAGWHLRYVDSGPNPTEVRGTVTGSARMQAVQLVPGTDGTAELTANIVTFELTGGTDPVGFDLGVGCASTTVRFELHGAIAPWPVQDIYVGREGRAVSNPLLIERDT